MKKIFKELVFWVFILFPYVYLSFIWNELPDKVPTHFDFSGNPDDWSSKNSLIFLPGFLGVGIYLLMLVVPVLDPKRKIQFMGKKYYVFRLMLTCFFSLLAVYIIYLSKANGIRNSNFLYAILGALFAILGNYFQAVRPNYFVGIRTPWTLENEDVWRKTHRMGGRLWMAGGILIVILSFIFPKNIFPFIFLAVTGFISIVPVVYSFIEFKKIRNNPNN